MKPLKPKDIAEKIGVAPSKVTMLAKDIENANLYRFTKTALGSFLFLEKEIELLKEYHQAIFFMGRKKFALEMMRQRIDFLIETKKERPEWTRFLANSIYR